jgi:hypothetical protein
VWILLDVRNVCNKNTFTVPDLTKHYKGSENPCSSHKARRMQPSKIKINKK